MGFLVFASRIVCKPTGTRAYKNSAVSTAGINTAVIRENESSYRQSLRQKKIHARKSRDDNANLVYSSIGLIHLFNLHIRKKNKMKILQINYFKNKLKYYFYFQNKDTIFKIVFCTSLNLAELSNNSFE